jgi:hypothetical protein
MNATVGIPYVLSLAMGKPQIAARLNTYALIVVLPVTALLIFQFGIVGAALSLVVYHLFAYAYLVPRICRQCLESPAASWYVHVLKVLGLGAATYVPAWLVLTLTNLSSILIAILAFAAGTAAFGVGAYLLVDRDLRHTMRRLPRARDWARRLDDHCLRARRFRRVLKLRDQDGGRVRREARRVGLAAAVGGHRTLRGLKRAVAIYLSDSSI